MPKKIRVDKTLAILIAILVGGGAFIFASAAFGSLARGGGSIASVVFNHVVLGVGVGAAGLVFFAMSDYRTWRRFAPWIYALTIIATALVFVPHLGASHGGGRRWVILFGISFQPSEALKLGVIVVTAAYFAVVGHRASSLVWGLGGYAAIMAVPSALLLLQPDIGTLGVIAISTAAVYAVAGARARDIAIVALAGLLAIALLAALRPYVRDRVTTFFHPAQGQQAESYQLTQSLIAVGSGGFSGRGLGQGIQKFKYLPEPMGDSIFAVAGEELGFVGASLIVMLYLAFALRGYAVALRAPDRFGALLGVGIATYLASEAFVNMSSMLGILPLTGIPLTFISQGGSAMLVSLASAGVLLSISRFSRRG